MLASRIHNKVKLNPLSAFFVNIMELDIVSGMIMVMVMVMTLSGSVLYPIKISGLGCWQFCFSFYGE